MNKKINLVYNILTKKCKFLKGEKMRYAIGYTYIDKETNFLSRPYLLTLSKNNGFDLKIDRFSEIKNERLIVVPTVEFGKNLIQTLKKLQTKKGNFYLLKIVH